MKTPPRSPTPHSSSTISSLPVDALRKGKGKNSSLSTSSPIAVSHCLLSSSLSSRSLSSHSDASLWASSSSSSGVGTLRPTCVESQEVQDCLAASRVREEVPDFPPALPPARFLLNHLPHRFLLRLPFRTALQEVIPRLALVAAPFASGARAALVLAGEGVSGSQLVEARGASLAAAGHRAVWALFLGDLVLGRRDPGFGPLPGFHPFLLRSLAAEVGPGSRQGHRPWGSVRVG